MSNNCRKETKSSPKNPFTSIVEQTVWPFYGKSTYIKIRKIPQVKWRPLRLLRALLTSNCTAGHSNTAISTTVVWRAIGCLCHAFSKSHMDCCKINGNFIELGISTFDLNPLSYLYTTLRKQPKRCQEVPWHFSIHTAIKPMLWQGEK